MSYPPLEAYRRDVARLGEGRTFGTDDGTWVASAMLLQRYVDGSPGERVGLAAELARYLAPEDLLSFPDAALRLATQIERAGALQLATSWLSLLDRALLARDALDVGRTRAHRASVARKLGALESAYELYAETEVVGKTNGEPELTARAWIGFAILAHMRGNYPEARRWYAAAAVVADDNGFVEQSFAARQGLLITVAGDFDRAMCEGWQAFALSSGDRDREAEVLTNLAQVLHEAGRHWTALRGFAAAVARTTAPAISLPALGGAASAAASLGRRDIVQAAAARVEMLAGIAWAHPLSSAFLDLAEAYGRIGSAGTAAAYGNRGRAIAMENRFHELAQRLDARDCLKPDAAQAPFGVTASRVVADIEGLEIAPDLSQVAT